MTEPRPVRQLPPETARKIAAGEVIDRPNAIVRELMDNAIDAGATSVCVEIEGGGIDKIRISDNGFGMTREDLEASVRPHATSKITSESDLLTLGTLGFRGEALASIAAVSRLEITTVRAGGIGYRLSAHGTGERAVSPCPWNEGTCVQSLSLFEDFPARRVFLKKPPAEAKLCRQTFLEKAIPWGEIAFRFVQDGKQKFDFPPHQSRAERFAQALELGEQAKLFREVKGGGKSEGFAFSVILGDAAVRKSDKKSIYVFVNGRRIWEYSLVQAVEYGSQGYFPNGTYPVAALFLEIEPHLVDFNIHPAKREARFRDIAPIHHAVSSCVRSFYRESSIAGLVLQAASQGEEPPEPTLYGESGGFFATSKAADSAGGASFAESAFGAEGTGGALGEFAESAADFSAPFLPNPPARNGSAGAGTFGGFGGGSRKSGAAHGAAHAGAEGVYHPSGFTYSNDFVPKPSGGAFSPREDDGYGFYNGAGAFACVDSAATYAGQAQAATPSQAAQGGSGAIAEDFRYLGTALGVFLVVEKGGSLFLIDQHAAHERILYNRFMAEIGSKQKLLFPYIIESESDADDAYLESLRGEMDKTGFEMRNAGGGTWEIAAVPVKWNGTEDDLRRDLLEKRIQPEELAHKIAAKSSCRAAIKDGTVLDDATAQSLALQAFALPDPHCPHGRPVWVQIAKRDLFRLIRRTEG